MTTLRRKLIRRFEEVFNGIISQSEDHPFYKVTDSVAELLADAALEVFYDKPKVDLVKSDPAWSILFGDQASQEANLQISQDIKAAQDAFERDLKFNPLPWESTKDWDKLSKFVVREYYKDNLIFAKYKTWQQNEGKYQALSNAKIKAKPADFIACFPDFLAHSAMYGKKDEGRGVKLDDHGAPITY